jgi:hypothetical protein
VEQTTIGRKLLYIDILDLIQCSFVKTKMCTRIINIGFLERLSLMDCEIEIKTDKL